MSSDWGWSHRCPRFWQYQLATLAGPMRAFLCRWSATAAAAIPPGRITNTMASTAIRLTSTRTPPPRASIMPQIKGCGHQRNATRPGYATRPRRYIERPVTQRPRRVAVIAARSGVEHGPRPTAGVGRCSPEGYCRRALGALRWAAGPAGPPGDFGVSGGPVRRRFAAPVRGEGKRHRRRHTKCCTHRAPQDGAGAGRRLRSRPAG
jgi:hypothetical protein